uniref:DUF5818 domain-containing protein n=1 Tax=Sphingomonas pituitosa TaxID=99597 RepID=UPI000836749A|nr:DUF5818 domain-containing protein [Sphingomonas pituitosa]
MPIGTQHEVVGILRHGEEGLVVESTEGGIWRLDAGWRAGRLIGHRVRIIGIRDGFDLLAVRSIERF